jgi:hypothetical protein
MIYRYKAETAFISSLFMCVCVCVFSYVFVSAEMICKKIVHGKIERTLSYCLRLIREVCFVSFVITLGILSTRACEVGGVGLGDDTFACLNL